MAGSALGANVGVDLWHYQTTDGRSIRRALEYLYPFAVGARKWPHQQLGEWPPQMLYPLLRRAAAVYGDEKIRVMLMKISATNPADREHLFHPQG